MSTPAEIQELVRRFWGVLFNEGRLEEAENLVAVDFSWRGSLGTKSEGIAGFLDYAHAAARSIPDLRVDILELTSVGEQAASRLSLSGTHRGPLLGVAATGRRFAYDAAATYRCSGGKIVQAWVVGDTHDLFRQLTSPD